MDFLFMISDTIPRSSIITILLRTIVNYTFVNTLNVYF